MNLKNYKLKYLLQDIPAGLITAFLSIPISMGYAQVAGLPVVFGLYGSVLPILVFGLITSSPRFVFGIDAAPAALTGALVVSLGITPGSREACALVPVISFITALWLLLFFLLKAGKAVRFISEPVLGGFITGIGMTIILMQIPKLFGGTSGTGELPELLIHIAGSARNSFNTFSLVLGLLTIIILRICARKCPKIPMSVVMMFLGALAEVFFHIHERFGTALLPAVNPGLPKLSLPDFSLVSKYGSDMIFSCLPIAIVILSESLLATNSFGRKYSDNINSEREIMAYAAANIISSICGCCPANGSISRTTIADQFGVKSQIMSVTASVTMACVLLFGTGFIKYLPVPVLTGIVISALISTLEFDLARKLRKCDRTECLIFWAAFTAVILLGTIYGVVIGVALSFLAFVIRQSDPPRAFMGIIPGKSGFYPLSEKSKASPIKGVIIYRFSGSLFFASTDLLCRDIENALSDTTKVVITDAGGIGSIDITAAERLVSLYEKLAGKNIKFYIAGHVSHINIQLRTFGAKELFINGAVKQSVNTALSAAGITEPYTLEKSKTETESGESPEYGDNIEAALEWAFGPDADKMINDLARRAALRLLDDNDNFSEDDLHDAAVKATSGYWNIVDEDAFLDILASKLVSFVSDDENSSDDEKIRKLSRIEKRIIARQIRIEEKLGTNNSRSLKYILQMRARVRDHVMRHHPDAIRELDREHEEYRKNLEKKDPELIRYLDDIKKNIKDK